MLIVRCIHCDNYNSQYCKECLRSSIPYIAYRERVGSYPTDISYEDLETKRKERIMTENKVTRVEFENGSYIQSLDCCDNIRGQRAKTGIMDYKMKWYQKLQLRIYLFFYRKF